MFINEFDSEEDAKTHTWEVLTKGWFARVKRHGAKRAVEANGLDEGQFSK